MGWIVDQGSDFPPSLTSLISSWTTSALFRSDPSRLTTRGWNGYGVSSSDRDHRSFRYTTPKKRLVADDLAGTPLLQARAIHLICSPSRCRELVPSIIFQRKAEAYARDPEGSSYVRPIFIWEPVPDLCTPDELLNCTNTLPLVDVCSPNHAELAGFMGCDGLDPTTGAISTAQVESACEQLLASMPLQSYSLVIRAGEKGCYVARNGGRKRVNKGGAASSAADKKKKKNEYVRGGLSHDTDMEALFAGLMQDDEGHVAREEIEVDPGIERWFPAYHPPSPKQPKDPGPDAAEGGDANTPKVSREAEVIDPTGGGNAFLGGLAIALARGKTIEEACAWANVAASFAIEQVGVPVLGKDGEGHEVWNGVRVEERLGEYMAKF